MSDEKKPEYNPTLAMLYETKVGYWSLPIDTKNYDAIMKHVEQGARLVVKRAKTRKTDKSPHAYLEIIPAAKVKEMEAARAKRKSDDI